MSIYGKEQVRQHVKKVIDGKEYEVTLGALDNLYVPEYASYAADMRKVMPAQQKEKQTEKKEELQQTL